MIKVIAGEVKSGNRYYGKGDIVDGLSKGEEKWLIREGLAEEVDADEIEEGLDSSEGGINLDKMTEKQLKEFAKLNNIDITGAKGKKQIAERIATSLESDDGKNGDEDGDGDGEGDA